MKQVLAWFASMMLLTLVLAWFGCGKDYNAYGPAEVSVARQAYYTPDTINVKTITVKPWAVNSTFAGFPAVYIHSDTSIGFYRYVGTSIWVDHVPYVMQGKKVLYTTPCTVINGTLMWRPFFDDQATSPIHMTQSTNRGVMGLYHGNLDSVRYTGVLIYYYNYPDTHYFSQPFKFYGPK